MYNLENMSGYFCCDNFGYYCCANVADNVVSSLYPLVLVLQNTAKFWCEIHRVLIPPCCSVGTVGSFPEGKVGGVSS
jgi:hypothetical protein